MLRLLTLPIELLRLAFCGLQGLVDVLRGHNRMRYESTVLINAPREAVWRFSTAHHMVLDGPPLMETSSEPIPDTVDLWLSRVAVSGQLRSQAVSREIERDETRGIARLQWVEHALNIPPLDGRDIESGFKVEGTPEGTAFTIVSELTVRAFRDRIIYPVGLRRMANLMKQQCEKQAGAHNRFADIANHGLILSVVALLSFWYLLGSKFGLLLAVVILLHEGGHAAAMLIAGVGVRGIYLVPFFGGAAVPKTSYRTEGRLGFIALMGPALSLIPTIGLFIMFRATGDIQLREATMMFAVVNAANLLPIYPLDGGLILNALIGSVSRRSALIAGWIGILIGLGLAIYLQSFLIGVPFVLFALQRYLSGNQTIELERLSFVGGTALTLAFIATFVMYAFVISITSATPASRRLRVISDAAQSDFALGITRPQGPRTQAEQTHDWLLPEFAVS